MTQEHDHPDQPNPYADSEPAYARGRPGKGAGHACRHGAPATMNEGGMGRGRGRGMGRGCCGRGRGRRHGPNCCRQ